MIGRLVLSFIAPAATGWLVVTTLLPPASVSWRDHILRGALSIGLGLGLASCAFFAAVVLAGPSRGAVVTADALLLLGALGFHRLARARGRTERDHASSAAPAVGLRLLRGSAATALVSGGVAFWLIAALQPHGDWDAWAIWNLRARFLFRGGGQWADGFSPLLGWSHPDYPLLVSGLVARAWWYVGRETVLAPMAVAFLFAAATVAAVGAAVAALRTESQGWVAALLLASTPAFVRQATTQFADVPLAFFYLAALVALALTDRAREKARGVAAVAGVALGLAAWTKNEGLAFGVAVLLARLAIRARRAGGDRSLARALAPAGVGLLPGLLVLVYFRLGVAPPSEYLTLPGLGAKLTDVGRYVAIARAVGRELLGFGGWPISVVGLLVVYALVVGLRLAPEERTAASSAALAVGLTAGGYAGAYLATPHPLEWHLATSLPRLAIQLWPAALFAYFLLVTPPEAAGRARPG